MAYLHTAFDDLKTSLDAEAGACDLAITTTRGLKSFQVSMPIKERIQLSLQYLVAASKLDTGDDSFVEFGESVNNFALELYNGEFMVTDDVIATVRNSDGATQINDANMELIMQDAKLRAIYENSLNNQSRNPERYAEQTVRIDTDMLAERWVYGKILEKAMDVAEEHPIMMAYARSQRVRLAFKRAKMKLDEFDAFHMRMLDTVVDSAGYCYDELDDMVDERLAEIEKSESPDHIGD